MRVEFFIPVKVVIFTYTKFKHIIMASKLEKKEKINFINEVEYTLRDIAKTHRVGTITEKILRLGFYIPAFVVIFTYTN